MEGGYASDELFADSDCACPSTRVAPRTSSTSANNASYQRVRSKLETDVTSLRDERQDIPLCALGRRQPPILCRSVLCGVRAPFSVRADDFGSDDEETEVVSATLISRFDVEATESLVLHFQVSGHCRAAAECLPMVLDRSRELRVPDNEFDFASGAVRATRSAGYAHRAHSHDPIGSCRVAARSPIPFARYDPPRPCFRSNACHWLFWKPNWLRVSSTLIGVELFHVLFFQQAVHVL